MPELNEPLSERELEILRLVATGAANKEIAHQLVISPNTVKVHVRNIFDKIGVSSRTEATLYAIKIGLVKHQDGFDSTGDPAANVSADASALAAANAGGSTPAEANGKDPTTTAAAHLSESPLQTAQDGKPRKSRARLRPWMAGLLIIAALVLLAGSGILGARLLAAPTPSATTAIQATTQTQPVGDARWAEKAALPSPRKGMGIVEYENGIYVLAGETSQGIDGAVLRYDQIENSWEAMPGKPTPVTDIQAAVIGEKIYVPGGRQADGVETNHLEVFDPRKGAWERKADLPIPLSAYSLAIFEGRLYLFGGKNGEKYSAGVFVYDPVEDRWDERASMTSPRAYSGAVVSNGKIIIMGGTDGQQALNINEAYIPTRDYDGSGETPWKTLVPLPEGRYAMGISQLAGMVFLMGGVGDNGQPLEKPALQYTVQSNQWSEYENPPTEIGAYLGQLASGNFLHILGGETSAGLSASNLTYQAIYTTTAPILINEGNP